MRRLAVLGTVCLTAALAACGQGRVIFNVDVLSFLQPAGDDTLRYDVLGGIPQTDSTVSRQFSLPPGLGKSSVDQVQVTGAAVLENTSGGGDVTFQVFFAKTQGSLFTGTPYINASSGPVSGADTVQLLPPTTVSLADSVFNATDLWVGIRARIATNVGPNMAGRLRLSQLSLRVVLQDKIF
jgi:hypothetical protein